MINEKFSDQFNQYIMLKVLRNFEKYNFIMIF